MVWKLELKNFCKCIWIREKKMYKFSFWFVFFFDLLKIMFILKILNGDIYEFFKNEIFYELWDDGEGYIEDG